MEAMRQSWTDDRLDDLVVRVDRGFWEVDKRFESVDERFQQIDERFEKVDQRFEGVQSEFVAVRREMKEGFEGIHRLMIYVIVALVSVMTAGFGSLAVLIAG